MTEFQDFLLTPVEIPERDEITCMAEVLEVLFPEYEIRAFKDLNGAIADNVAVFHICLSLKKGDLLLALLQKLNLDSSYQFVVLDEAVRHGNALSSLGMAQDGNVRAGANKIKTRYIEKLNHVKNATPAISTDGQAFLF